MYLGSAADGLTHLELLKSKPSMFNADGLCVEQHMALSADGVEIPYFVIRKKNIALDGSHPTLLDGAIRVRLGVRFGWLG